MKSLSYMDGMMISETELRQDSDTSAKIKKRCLILWQMVFEILKWLIANQIYLLHGAHAHTQPV